MWKKMTVLLMVLAVPADGLAGPLAEAAKKAAADLASTQQSATGRNRTRFLTGIGLLAGGGVMTLLGGMELGDDETGLDDGEDMDDSDDGEDSDGWGNKALLGGGIAAAALGGVLLLTGRRFGPVVSAQPGRVVVRHTVRF